MLDLLKERTKAILLLTSFFNKSEIKTFKLLTVNEYGYLAKWLHYYKYSPTDLLNSSSLERIFEQWDKSNSHTSVKEKVDFYRLDNTIKNITAERISLLVARGASMSLALEKWGNAGIWIMDRSDEYYPAIFKKSLQDRTPAIIFGIGNKVLLKDKAIGFVGSRDINDKDIIETERLVQIANNQGYSIVSGGAKGVDITAMSSSLKNEHHCIGVLTDNLFRNSASPLYRSHLKANNLVLISPFFPEGSFTPANAMERNKYVYLLSQKTVVVKSGIKGGTWSGATENIKKNWVPLLVVENDSSNYEGNQKLLSYPSKEKQIKPFPITSVFSSFDEVIEQKVELKELKEQPVQAGLFEETRKNNSTETSLDSIKDKYGIKTASSMLIKQSKIAEQEDTEIKSLDFYKESSLLNIFYRRIQKLIYESNNKSIGINELEAEFSEFQILGKLALSKWVNKLVSDKKLLKKGKIKTYYLPNA